MEGGLKISAAAAPNAKANGGQHASLLGRVVPVIDMTQPEAYSAREIREACKDHGFFTIKNHGIEKKLVDAVFEENKKFFALPLAKKMEIAAGNVKQYRGYTAMQDETLDPKHSRAGDTKEGLYFGREVSADDPEAQKPLTGPNQWPPEDLLPHYRAVTEEYMAALSSLGLRLVRLIALALYCTRDYFDDMFATPTTTLRPLHYSAAVSDPKLGLFGAGAHSDYGMLTILKTGKEDGLQISLHGEWADIEPTDDTFICNIGDLLERWSNGLFKSTLHRVLGRGKERYSIPFFYDPHGETAVECLPQCCSPSNPAKYPPTTACQHLMDIYAKTHASYQEATAEKA